MSRWVLGINTAYHEPAACLLRDGEIAAMVEEERFNRFRHGKRSRIDNPDELPERAMEWCLSSAGIGWDDLAAIACSLDPEERLRRNSDLPDRGRVLPGGWGTPEGEEVFYRHNLRVREILSQRAPRARFWFLSHHLCHAASAFYPSPFEQAAVLVVDGIGEIASTWSGAAEGDDLRPLGAVEYPHSIGFVWERMSEFLGFDVYSGPGKVMGYACITDPVGELTGRDHLEAMRSVFRPDGDGFFVDNEAFRFRTGDFSGLERLFGPRRKTVVDRYEEASIAAALQVQTQEVLVHLCRRLYQRLNAGRANPITDLCLAGGVALNCVATYEIASRTPFRRIWVQPMANDAGTALGAAVLADREAGGAARPRMEHAFFGPGFSGAEIEEVLRRRGLASERPDSIAEAAAARVERGEIVAWFQGRQEVGPRALGHRTILADPTRFDSRNRINLRVKMRESFRPFAPSVLPSGVSRFFEQPADLLARRFMLAALPLANRRLAQVIPAVIQENGSSGKATARIHEVLPEVDPLYAEVIAAFERRTGIPMLLNTSFNIGEPIVTTPDQALDTFLRSSMDALALGPFLVPNPRAA